MPVLAGTMAWASSYALHMVSFEIFVKAMPPSSLSELKVLPSFCLAFKIPDNRAASSKKECSARGLTCNVMWPCFFQNYILSRLLIATLYQTHIM